MAAKAAGRVKRAEAELLRFALAYPDAYEDHPWGERVAKVKGKVFVFLSRPSDGLNVTVKLPTSATLALGLPFVQPTGYGLAKSGWVTASFGPRDRAPVAVLKQWIDESYRAVAPKKLVARLAASNRVLAPRQASSKHLAGSESRLGGLGSAPLGKRGGRLRPGRATRRR